jgi:hypothetical protein
MNSTVARLITFASIFVAAQFGSDFPIGKSFDFELCVEIDHTVGAPVLIA